MGGWLPRGFAGHLSTPLLEDFALGPRETPHSMSGDFLEDRIDLRGQELLRAHALQTGDPLPLFEDGALDRELISKAELLRIHPRVETRDDHAQRSNHRHREGQPANRRQAHQREGEVFGAQPERENEEKMHDDFEFRENGGIRRKDRDGARSHAGDREFRHDQPLGQSADNNSAEKNRGEMPGTDNRLDLAPGEKQQQHAGQQVQRIVVDQRKGEKSPVIARVDAGAVEGQPAKEEILPAVAVTEEKLGGHLRTERPDAQRDQERRGRGTPRRPRPDECLELATGVAHAARF